MALSHFFTSRRAQAAVLGVAALTLMPIGTARADWLTTSALCAAPIATAEIAHELPDQLLAAVALIESGRWLEAEQRNIPWPWTVYAESKGRYFATKEEAVAEVRRLKAKGVGNIDVGCMQINLYHHPDAFADLEEAFTPERNIDYAARFLLRLYEAKRSWAAAVASYHSSTPEFAQPYKHKFVIAWNAERRRVKEIRRSEKLAEIERRRAEREKDAGSG